MEIPLEKENQAKLVKFMIRMGVFSVLYLIPLLTVIGCYFYEHTYRSIWETTWMEENCRRYHIPCPYKVTTEVELVPYKYVKYPFSAGVSAKEDIYSM